MRKVFFAGASAAAVFGIANVAIALLNRPDDAAVTAGYFVLLALVCAIPVAGRLWRRL
jgi:hypothetical protein